MMLKLPFCKKKSAIQHEHECSVKASMEQLDWTCANILGVSPLVYGVGVSHREGGHCADGLGLLRVPTLGFQQGQTQMQRVALDRTPVFT